MISSASVSGAAHAVPGPKRAVTVVVGSPNPGTKSWRLEKSKLPTANGAPAVSMMSNLRAREATISPVGHTGLSSKVTSSAVREDTAPVGTTSSTLPQEETNDVRPSPLGAFSAAEDAAAAATRDVLRVEVRCPSARRCLSLDCGMKWAPYPTRAPTRTPATRATSSGRTIHRRDGRRAQAPR